MLEYIYINYVLIIGTSLVSLTFTFSLLVWLFNYLVDLIQAVWQDIKYFVKLVWNLISSIIVPLLRVWWIVTRAPFLIMLIILNSLKYLLGGMYKILSKYWKSYRFLVREDTIWNKALWTRHEAYRNRFMRWLMKNTYRKYLYFLYPSKYTSNRHLYTLAFLWGYLLRWCSYLFYLMFYYVIFLLRNVFTYIWIKPYIIEMFFFVFYYIYRSLGWWMNMVFYKLCWNGYVFIRRQLYYFMPNWLIADLIKEFNLNWYEWNFETNFRLELHEDGPEDIFMNNPNKKVVDFFFNIMPVTTLQQLSKNNYSNLFSYHFFFVIIRYFVILPICLIVMFLVNIILIMINIVCLTLFTTHNIWWKFYKYFLRQQYYLYTFLLNIDNCNLYKLLILPIYKLLILILRWGWLIITNFVPQLISQFFCKILALLFYIIYSFTWCIYHLPALITASCIWTIRLLLRYRVPILIIFLLYYWVYDQCSELGNLGLGIIQSSVESFLRKIWFYLPIDPLTAWTGTNKYEFVKYWGSMHNINKYIFMHYYPGIWKPDLAYMGYYQLNMWPEPLNHSIDNIQTHNWPFYYNRQRGFKFYRRSFIERDQMQWNLWFFKFIEGTYIWDPASLINYKWNEEKDFNVSDFQQFFTSKYIFKRSGTPIEDLFWFFQEDDMEKWHYIMNGLPRYYLFEPNVLQEEAEILPNGWFNWESWTNWFYYDILNTSYLVPFDLPIEGSKQGAIGYQPGHRPPHLFTMLNSIDPVEYSRATGRQQKGLPVLKNMHFVKVLYQMRDGLLSRKDELIRANIQLLRDKAIWDELYSENIGWKIRLFTAVSYPFKWITIHFELIRISIFKLFVYTKATFWLYYYYYQPEIRIFFYFSVIQKIIIIYPFKWLCFCWQLANSVFPLPYKTVSFIFSIFSLVKYYFMLLVEYIYYVWSSPYTSEYINQSYYILSSVLLQLKFKLLCISDILIYVKSNSEEINFYFVLNNFNYSKLINYILYLTWLYHLYCKLYIYLSLDEYYIYLTYKYNCYMWYLNHLIQGYLYLLEHSFYIQQGKLCSFTFIEFLSRRWGPIDRRVIYDIVGDTKNILSEGYIRKLGPWVTGKQIHYSWLKNVTDLFYAKDWGTMFINYSFFYIWYYWDLLCQFIYHLLDRGQDHGVFGLRHTTKSWLPLFMVWLHKIQCILDDLYIYMQFPRRLNKYGLTYTARGYTLLDELNMFYVVRRTKFGDTHTWKSLNMLTYLVLMVQYPSTWEHFTMVHNSPNFINANGLRVVANKIFANVSGWSSGIYYLTITLLIFFSTSFRNLLFCTTASYDVALTNNREYNWQKARSLPGRKLDWLLISKSTYKWVQPFVELSSHLSVHMDFYTKLMYMNNKVPLPYDLMRWWVEEMRKNTLTNAMVGYEVRDNHISPMSMAYILNPHYNSLQTNIVYSSNNFAKLVGYARHRDINIKLAGKNIEINRAYSEVHPTYLYNKSYLDLHIKQLDKWYYSNFNLDRYLFNYNLPDWAWHKDGFNMRMFSSKNPVDLTQQLTYVYEDERVNYIPWTVFGWFLAVPLCLVIKPLAGLGQWLMHSHKEDPAWGWHFSYYFNNFWYHIYLIKYFYYLTGPWIPETKLLASLDTEESEEYWHYHEQSAFLREFFYSYEDEEPVDIYQLLYTRWDSLWESSLEEMRLCVLFSLVLLLLTLLIAPFKKKSIMKINLNQIYSNQYISQWDSIKYYSSLKYYLHKIFKWFYL